MFPSGFHSVIIRGAETARTSGGPLRLPRAFAPSRSGALVGDPFHRLEDDLGGMYVLQDELPQLQQNPKRDGESVREDRPAVRDATSLSTFPTWPRCRHPRAPSNIPRRGLAAHKITADCASHPRSRPLGCRPCPMGHLHNRQAIRWRFFVLSPAASPSPRFPAGMPPVPPITRGTSSAQECHRLASRIPQCLQAKGC